MDGSIAIIFTTATGHTEFVVDRVIGVLEKKLTQGRILKQRAEVTDPSELSKHRVLILACGSWNTGNVEGQLSPHMHDLLTARARSADLRGVQTTAIGLGDRRYHFTAKAADHLTTYLQERGATTLIPTLKIVDDPYDQEKKIDAWATELSGLIKHLPALPA